MTSLILDVGLTLRSSSISYLTSIKLLEILVIIYRSAHHNNSNEILLFMAMYIYLTDTKVDIIIFLN